MLNYVIFQLRILLTYIISLKEINITCCNWLGLSRMELLVLGGYANGLFGLLLADLKLILKN